MNGGKTFKLDSHVFRLTCPISFQPLRCIFNTSTVARLSRNRSDPLSSTDGVTSAHLLLEVVTIDDEEDEPQHDFMEVFSPPRVAIACRRRHMLALHSLDELTGYDLLQFECRARALHLIDACKPKFIMLSPPCTMYSQLQTMWNLKKWDEETKRSKFAVADCMLDFSMFIANKQLAQNRFFCFEHPASAHSWKRAAVQEIMNHPDVTCTSFDQCRTGLTCPETGRPIKKRTTLMSNAPGVPLQFRPLQCHCSVPHVRIQGSSCGVRLSTYCQIYTPELCDHLAAACERTLHS